MEKTKGRRAAEIAISILAALAVWIYVDLEKAPSVTANYRGIPVEFINEDTVLADNNLMLLDGYDATVDLKLEAPRKELRKLDTENIRLIVDTSNIAGTGVKSLRWNIYFPDTVSSNNVKVADASAYTVTVTVGELFTKEVPVYCDVVGQPAEGYVSGTLKISPDTLILHAQRENLLDVSYAKVTLDVTEAKRTLVKSMNAELFDYNDNPVDAENIRISNGLVQVTQPIFTTKEVPLIINFTGAAGSIGDSVQCSIYPASVTLLGEEEELAAINSISLETIDVQKLAASQKKNYTIKAPDNTYLLGSNTIATATITVTGTTEKVVNVSDITCAKVKEGLEAEVPGSLSLTVWGNVEEVDEIQAENITVTADLSEVSEPGTYSVSVVATINGYSDVAVKGTYQVTVYVTESEIEPIVPIEDGNGGNIQDNPAQRTITAEKAGRA